MKYLAELTPFFQFRTNTCCDQFDFLKKITKNMTTINFKPHLDLDNIPILKKGQLCTLLDPNRLWRRLAELMEFSDEQISVSCNSKQ